LRAKFTSDSHFFVCEVGRGSGVLQCSLKIAEVLWGGGRRWWRQEASLHIFTHINLFILDDDVQSSHSLKQRSETFVSRWWTQVAQAASRWTRNEVSMSGISSLDLSFTLQIHFKNGHFVMWQSLFYQKR